MILLKVVIPAMLSVLVTSSASAKEIPLTCSPPEGSLRVALYVGATLSTYHWTSTGIMLVEERNLRSHPMKRPNPWKTSGGDISKWSMERAGVDQSLVGHGWRLDAAYDVSPDGTWLASAVFPAHDYTLPKRLALINRADQQITHILDLPYYLYAVTWAPSGRTVAVLSIEDVTEITPKSFGDWLGSLIGHPSSYRTVRVAFYNLKGQKRCEQLFQEQVPSGRGYLEWLPE